MSTSRNFKVSEDVAKLMDLNSESFEAEEDGNSDDLASILSDDFKIVRSNFSVSDKQEMLGAVPANAGKGRSVDTVAVEIYGDTAVVTSRLTTRNQASTNCFWNTKVFAKHDGEWRCRAWQVARIL